MIRLREDQSGLAGVIEIIIAVLVMAAVIFVGYKVYSDRNNNNQLSDKDTCGINDTSDKAVPAPNVDLTKTKAVGYDPVHGQFRGRLQEAKDVNANTILIFVDAKVEGNKIIWDGNCYRDNYRAMLGSIINEAHENGFAVKVRETQSPTNDRSILKNNKQVADAYAEFIREIAIIAEEFNVEQLSISGELDTTWSFSISKRPIWTEMTGSDLTPLAQKSLAAVKKVYSGKVGVGLGDPNNIYSKDKAKSLNLKGYDFFEFSAYADVEDTNFVDYLDNLPDLVKISKEIASDNNINDVHVGETGVLNPDESLPGELDWGTVTVSEEKEAEFYDKLFDKTYDQVQGYNIGFLQTFFTPIDEPGQETLQEWFGSL